MNAGGTVTTEPSIGAAVVLDGLGDGVEDRHAVDLAAACGPGVTPPTIFEP